MKTIIITVPVGDNDFGPYDILDMYRGTVYKHEIDFRTRDWVMEMDNVQVYELENFIERGVALEKGQIINASSLPSEVIYNLDASAVTGADWQAMLGLGKLNLTHYIDNISKSIIIKALELHNGNVKKTAASLQVNYRSLRYLIDKFKLKFHS